MSSCRDVIRQCVFMCFFIIPIPIGAYTIHNGSSAAVALISYGVLSLGIPWCYLGSKEAAFGPQNRRISRMTFCLMWLIVSLALGAFSSCMDDIWRSSPFWEWPTVGRDVVFIFGMYGTICLIMLLSYGMSGLTGVKKKERG